MKSYRNILLDVDDTLLDFEAAERQGIHQVLSHYGFLPNEEYLARYKEINKAAWAAFERGEVTKERLVNQRFEEFFRQLGKTVDGEEAEEMYRGCLDSSAVLIDGAMELCGYLKEKGYGLYVVTNGTSTTQYKRLALSGLDKFMDGIFVSEDAGSQKPQKEYFDYCFERISDGDPQTMILLGDSLTSDILGGITAGVDTCWYNPGKLAGRTDILPVYEIDRLDQFRTIV